MKEAKYPIEFLIAYSGYSVTTFYLTSTLESRTLNMLHKLWMYLNIRMWLAKGKYVEQKTVKSPVPLELKDPKVLSIFIA